MEPQTPVLIQQPGGRGALLSGGQPGNKGGGAIPYRVRYAAAQATERGIPVMDLIIQGGDDYTPLEKVAALRVVSDVSGVNKPEVQVLPQDLEELTVAYFRAFAMYCAEQWPGEDHTAHAQRLRRLIEFIEQACNELNVSADFEELRSLQKTT
jgi:hypothetical protein